MTETIQQSNRGYTMIKNSRMALVVLAALTGCVGCVSSGTRVDADQLAQFKAGVTTESEIVSKLGPPNNSMTQPDGTRIDMYIHTAMKQNAANFIPYMGLFKGGASTDTETVTFTFDSRGVLKTTATSNSQQQFHSGIANQN
jgi:outer membrane protein assembly factor BamE (lipoprotein component of BamABCDE complex)